ncbi:MAG: 1,4-dihydroxy-6-naphthoate synthase [Vicingaceae bacterium]
MSAIRIGLSPCPNDTFIFDALLHQKIDTQGLNFEAVFADVEELNSMAFKGELEVSKLSYHALALLLKDYQILNSGSALGSGVGPLLIAKRDLKEQGIDQARIAIPGKYTTANFLLSLAYPRATDKRELLFSEIENAVLNEDVDAGLIIHENRFTYQEKGLVKLIDLGNYWEEVSGSLIPLGGIAAKRSMDEKLKKTIDQLIHQSIAYAFENPESSKGFVAAHSQEMNEAVCQQHIDLYVNQYSLDLGQEGRSAVSTLFEEAKKKEIIETIYEPIFT